MAARNRIKVLRSKNASPFVLTFDMVFRNPQDFESVRSALTPDRIAKTFGVTPKDVFPVGSVDELLALKFSIRRRTPSGHPGDSDCYGMNQEEPLARLIDSILPEEISR